MTLRGDLDPADYLPEPPAPLHLPWLPTRDLPQCGAKASETVLAEIEANNPNMTRYAGLTTCYLTPGHADAIPEGDPRAHESLLFANASRRGTTSAAFVRYTWLEA